jgi:hypothetical protein
VRIHAAGEIEAAVGRCGGVKREFYPTHKRIATERLEVELRSAFETGGPMLRVRRPHEDHNLMPVAPSGSTER